VILFSCRRAAEVTSRELDGPLPLGERLAVGVHRLVCPTCQRYRTQLTEINRAVAEYVSEPAGPDGEQLAEESKMRIKQVLGVAVQPVALETLAAQPVETLERKRDQHGTRAGHDVVALPGKQGRGAAIQQGRDSGCLQGRRVVAPGAGRRRAPGQDGVGRSRGASGRVRMDEFAHHFDQWIWDWLDVPALLRNADCAFENPMIDRDPVPTWADGPVALLGDAAHAMYPTGSNGASQAIVDARVLGAAMIQHGVTHAALAAYDAKLCGPISQLVLRNRGAGPFGLLNMVDARCGGTFDNIDDVIPPKERADFMAGYKAAAGLAIETLNRAPPTIPKGARVRI